MKREPTLRELLALPDDTELRLVARCPVADGAPEGNVRHALATLLVMGSAWTDAFSDHALQAYRAQGSPTYLAFARSAVHTVVAGTPVDGGELLGFDVTHERVTVRLVDDDAGEWVVHAHDGALELFELQPADPLADLGPPAPPPPSLPAPPVAEWATLARAEPWLARAAAELAEAPGHVERAAAAGLLARLWSPPLDAPRTVPPREAVRAWAHDLPPGALDQLERTASRRADALAQALEGHDPVDEAAARSIALRRDDLQSVRRVLRLAGRGTHLSDALAEVDRVAAAQTSRLTDALPPLDDDPLAERWIAVAGQEPDAWWAGLA